ncbi:Succinylglutamate desuccinylase [Bienertia sinuspersici]
MELREVVGRKGRWGTFMEIDEAEIERKCGYTKDQCTSSEGNSGGLRLWWHNVNINIESYSRHHIAVKELDEQDRPLWLAVGLYGWAEQANKFHTWELIKSLVDQHQRPLIFCGDFNEILLNKEEGGVGGGRRSIADF